MKFIFSTGNKGKLREAQEILGPSFELVTPADMGILEEIPETGDSLQENSLQKAMYLYEKTGLDCFADDTGLEVDALGGEPGVYTSRYAGEHCSFDDNMEKLLKALSLKDAQEGRPVDRSARFRSVVTLLIGGEPHYFEGVMNGRIATAKAGCGGFGYDPVFIADEYPDRTVAEISEESKNEISHRGKAIRQMAAWLESHKG